MAAAVATSLAELGLLLPGRSEAVERTMRRMAELARLAGQDAAETTLLGYADEVARWRRELPPPVPPPDV
jgi:hypothetical protein